MTTIKRSVLAILAILPLLVSCAKDNYPAPAETFKGSFVEKGTGLPFQAAIGNTGIRIRMMEYSWSETPQPYDMYVKQDGTFQNTKVFKGQYGITPEGAFVPLKEEIVDIKGVVEKKYEVEPLLKVEWVGAPVVNADGTVTVKVKVTRGTTDPDYQQAVEKGWLFVSETNYVGDFSYSPNYSTKLSGAEIPLGETITVTTGHPNGTAGAAIAFPSYQRKYFLRFAAKTTKNFSNTERYNYTPIVEVTTGGK